MRVPGIVSVNIHTKGRIPWLNILGPRYDMALSISIFNLLKADPRVEIYTTEEDLKRGFDPRKKVEVQQPVAQSNQEIKPKVEPVLEVKEEPIVEVELIKSVKLEEFNKELPKTEMDLEIEARINELPEEPELEFRIPEDDTKKMRVYDIKDLKLLTKADLKKILNEERGFVIGDKYYGGYHDNHKDLVKFILESQKE